MQILKKYLAILHTPNSFIQYGFKQVSTWLGIALFIAVFYQDIHTLIHNVLTSSMLSEKIISGLCGIILILFNRFTPNKK